MKLLVCGGRHFGLIPKWVRFGDTGYSQQARKAEAERLLLDRVLSACEPRPCILIHGAAQGADELARRWAARNGIPDLPFKADWYPQGFGRLDKSAGPCRNQRMIDEGKPDRVIAMPGGRGTADMISRARAAGIEVVEVENV